MVRVKQRYYLLEVILEDHLDPSPEPIDISEWEIHRAIKAAVAYIHGDYGVALVQAGLCVKIFNPLTRVCLVRVRRSVHTLVGSSLPFVHIVGEEKASLRTLHLGGTVRSCLKFLIKFDQEQIAILSKRCLDVIEVEKFKIVSSKTHRKLANEESDVDDS